MGGFLRFFGQFHPIVVHFPIALLIFAAGLELVNVWCDHAKIRAAIGINLLFGAVAAIVAAALGWADAATMGMESELKNTLFWHRWLGTGVALWAIFTVVVWFQQQRDPQRIRAYRTILWAGALLVGVTGHLGGTLVYGLDYISFTEMFHSHSH